MIFVTKLSELSFTIEIDPSVLESLSEAAGWSSPERALTSILSDALLCPSLPYGFYDDLDEDVPF